MEWVFVKMMLSLAAVLGLMFVVVMLLKRFVLPGRVSGSHKVEIDILGQKTLQPKRSVVVLKVLDRVLVVGMSEQGMQLLTELSAEEQPHDQIASVGSDQLLPEQQRQRRPWWEKATFASFLRANQQLLEKK